MTLVLNASGCSTPAGSPFDDAVAVWDMGGVKERAKNTGKLTCQGEVKLGIELQGDEREASLRRGGDGRVAEFRGGHLVATGPDGQPLELTGSEMTLCFRVRDPQGKWDTPLFARQAPDDKLANLLYCAQVDRAAIGAREAKRIKEGKALEFRWRTVPAADSVIPEYFDDPWYKGLIVHFARVKEDFLNGVLRISAPVELIGPNQWHDVVARFKGPNLELFIDGVLVDEEWPHGDLHRFEGPFLIGAGYKDGQLAGGFNGQIDHVALWKRALRDEEITGLSGGKKEVARRDVEILGPESTSLQYWRPRGYNAFVGDCMPFWDGTRLHVYYIFVRRHLESKWLAVGGGFGHVSTKDLVHWEQHPMALSITDPTECALGTGQFIYHEGQYYLFYVQHGRRIKWKDAPYQGDKIFLATSTDGIHFQKHPEPLSVMEYLTGNDMNPSVWPDATGRRWFMNVSGLSVLTSADLLNWKETAELPWLQEGTFFRGAICTSYFHWNDWYYFCNPGLYRKSREPMEAGKWETIDRHDLIVGGICVPEAVGFGKNRYLWVGFGEGAYGQELVIRELVQNPDGTLGTKWPAEMIPASGEPLKLAFEPLRGNATGNAGAVHINAQDGVGIAMLKDVPQNVRITLRIKPGAGVKYFGVTFRGKGNYEDGCELRFDPGRRRAQYGVPENSGLAKEYEGEYIENLAGLDGPFVLDVIVKDDIVDACIDNRRTILKRQAAQGDRLFLFAKQGDVVFEDISVRPLTASPIAQGAVPAVSAAGTEQVANMEQCRLALDSFYEASKAKDVARCIRLGQAIRRFMARDPDWPIYHLTAPMGWISDPNGAIYSQGKYHLFYQHNPVVKGNLERWGHVVSEDLVHWKDWPIAIWADTPLDNLGALSGNIVIDDRGIPTALYTGHRAPGRHDDALGVRARSTDGMISFGDKKAVMDKPPYPGSPCHWDGQTWKDGDTWFQLCGGTYEGGGAAVLWSSPDLEHWTFRNRIFTSKNYGPFWEFPYLVPFGEKYVLMIGVWPVRYWVGTYDKKTMTFRPDDEEHPHLLDHANPYHCMNPGMMDDKGPGGAPRRIIHACMFGFSDELMATRSKEVPKWTGMHVLPRVIKLEGDRLWQEPVPELQSLRGRHTVLRDRTIPAGKAERVDGFSSDAFEAIAEFEPGTARRFGLRLRLAGDGRECVEVFVDPAANTFGARGHFGEKTGPAHLKPGEPVRMRVFVDRSIVEVYFNGETLSQRFFADPKSLGVAAFADGGPASLKSLDLWQMNSMWLEAESAAAGTDKTPVIRLSERPKPCRIVKIADGSRP